MGAPLRRSGRGCSAAHCGLVVGLAALVYPSASFTPAPAPASPAFAGAYPAARRAVNLKGLIAYRRTPPRVLPPFRGLALEMMLAGGLRPSGSLHAGQHARARGVRGAVSALRRGSTVVSEALSGYIGGDGFQESASESEWLQVSEGITAEMAEDCSVEEAAGIASIIALLMESCSEKSQRLPRSAGDVLQALLSHPAGSQAFWTTFLTDPDLERAVQEPFEPALIRSIERFPELNIGVVSSCLAMSATEEALFEEEEDKFMSQSAAESKERVLALLKSITRQPDSKRGKNHCSSR
jgi:hypothetical protein